MMNGEKKRVCQSNNFSLFIYTVLLSIGEGERKEKGLRCTQFVIFLLFLFFFFAYTRRRKEEEEDRKRRAREGEGLIIATTVVFVK